MKIRDMPKLQSPFIREKNENGDYVVTPVTEDGYNWVFTDPDVLAVEKLHGCLAYQVAVETDEGLISIGKIVNNKLPVNVLSFNETTGLTEYKPIIHYHKEPNVDGYYCTNVKQRGHGTRSKNLITTPNHKFMTPTGWKRADDLVVGENVMVLVKHLDVVRKQLILGTLLGDSSVLWGDEKRNCGISGSHIIKQSEYFDLKMRLMGNLLNECKGSIGGFPGSTPNRRYTSVITKYTSEYIESHCLVDGKKTVCEEWVNELTPIAIAFWYMDDGSLMHNSAQYQRDRMRFSTNAFSLAEVELLQKKMLDSWNVASTIQNSGTSNGNVLAISADGTEILANLVAPYIIQSMKYKLPEIHRSGSCYWDDYVSTPTETLLETEVVQIQPDFDGYISNPVHQYDITVEDNSNYFIGGVLVHNTNVSIYIQDGVITGVWNRTARVPFFNRGKEYIIDGVREAFSRKYTEFLSDGQHFGECIGPKINGNPYKLDKPLWVPFSKLQRDYHYLSWGKYPKTFEAISEWFKELMPLFGRKHGSEFVEGIVFTHKDGRMAKIRRDMFEWYSGRRH